LLQQRAFQQYFVAAGRLDLARIADEATEQQSDADLALDAFLSRLPALYPPEPRLELSPEQMPLGEIQTGGKLSMSGSPPAALPRRCTVPVSKPGPSRSTRPPPKTNSTAPPGLGGGFSATTSTGTKLGSGVVRSSSIRRQC